MDLSKRKAKKMCTFIFFFFFNIFLYVLRKIIRTRGREKKIE